MSKDVIVTSADHPLGRALCEALLEEGYEVVGLAPTKTSIPGVNSFVVNLNQGHIPFVGEDVTVVNATDLNRDGNGLAVSRVNLRGSMNARKLSHGKFIHISSASVNDMRTPHINAPAYAVEQLTGTPLNDYVMSKRESEKMLEKMAPLNSSTTVLRPHLLYREGNISLPAMYYNGIQAGQVVLPDGGQALQTPTSYATLTQAVLNAVRLNAPGTYNVNDGVPVSSHDLIRQVYQDTVDIISLPFGEYAGRIHEFSRNRHSATINPEYSEYALFLLGLEHTFSIDSTRQAQLLL